MDSDNSNERKISELGYQSCNRITKFFKREPEKTVLFVYVENAGRSQIAEGFFNKYAPKRYRAISVRTTSVPKINPMAVEVRKRLALILVIKNPKTSQKM